MSQSTKTMACWAIAWIAAALLLVPQAAPRLVLAQDKEQLRENGPERTLFNAANRERAARGLSPLQWDGMLAGAAREHALHMVERNKLSHQFPGEPDLVNRIRRSGAHFVVLAENLAEGPSVPGLHTQWMNSPPHRENLLDPKLNSLGVAVLERNGQFFAVEDFSRAVSDLSFEEQEKQVGAQLQKRGLRVVSDAGDAQRYCKTGRSDGLARRTSYLVRYSTADLMILPDILLHELDSDRYHAAAVSACASNQAGDFSVYQLAVLLYE